MCSPREQRGQRAVTVLITGDTWLPPQPGRHGGAGPPPLAPAPARSAHRRGREEGRLPAGACTDLFLTNRPLYNLCQMFPEAASESVRFVLRDAMHEMEGAIEAKGRAAFPGLDVVSGLGPPAGPAAAGAQVAWGRSGRGR